MIFRLTAVTPTSKLTRLTFFFYVASARPKEQLRRQTNNKIQQSHSSFLPYSSNVFLCFSRSIAVFHIDHVGPILRTDCICWSRCGFGVQEINRVHFCILAVGIPHQLQAANLPCLAASMCLIPSFCLSRRWNVNHAPTLGLCPQGEIQLDCPGSTLSMCCQILTMNLLLF
jgi:hypothetical protein